MDKIKTVNFHFDHEHNIDGTRHLANSEAPLAPDLAENLQQRRVGKIVKPATSASTSTASTGKKD